MKKVAIFGKPAGGKSTLSKKLSLATNIELHSVDSILYKAGGEEVDRKIYDANHDAILQQAEWIIEGFGPLNSLASFNRRLETADTLIYIDLPYSVTYWLITKRCIQGLFKKPEGWPDNSSIIKGTLNSYKTLKYCPKFWNDDFLQRIEKLSEHKTLYVIRSISELDCFIDKYLRELIQQKAKH